MDESRILKALLTTKGRKTGNDHSVWLRAVMYHGKMYFSRHRPDGDWFQNAIKNRDVVIGIDGKQFTGIASVVSDEKLVEKISELKYPGEDRAKEKRVALEITLCE